MKCISLIFLLVFSSVNAAEKVQLSSQAIQSYNPLLPKLEPELWKQLVESEKKMSEGNADGKKVFLLTAEKLTSLHRMERSTNKISLGGIELNLLTKEISLDAKIKYPDGMPLEVILCQQKGRNHETLFITETRPLHLEILLHMAGYKKGDLLDMKVKGENRAVDLNDFLHWKKKSEDKRPVMWKFTGSEFGKEYIPDNAGEQVIVWSRNEAVLEVDREEFTSLEIPVYAYEIKGFSQGSKVKIIIGKMKAQRNAPSGSEN